MSRMATCQGCEWGSQSMPPTTRVSPATEDTARHDGGEKTRVSTSTRVCDVGQTLHPCTHPWTPPRPRLPTASLGPMAGGPPWLAPPSTWPLRGGRSVGTTAVVLWGYAFFGGGTEVSLHRFGGCCGSPNISWGFIVAANYSGGHYGSPTHFLGRFW